jgi:hypothetical protein
MAPELKQAYINYHGFPPDNFVESGQATIEDLPDLNADPEAVRVLDALKQGVDEITKKRRNGGDTNGDTPHDTEASSPE